MSECSPSACATCPMHELEEKMKKKMKEAKEQAEKEKAADGKAKAEKD